MSEELSIEEAWASIPWFGLVGTQQDAVRAGFLAVAKEIFREHTPALCGIWAAEYNDLLIEQIEKLGKEG